MLLILAALTIFSSARLGRTYDAGYEKTDQILERHILAQVTSKSSSQCPRKGHVLIRDSPHVFLCQNARGNAVAIDVHCIISVLVERHGPMKDLPRSGRRTERVHGSRRCMNLGPKLEYRPEPGSLTIELRRRQPSETYLKAQAGVGCRGA